MSKVPNQRSGSGDAAQDVTIAQLTAKADLILLELQGVIGEMAGMLRRGAGE